MGKKHASQYANFGWLPIINTHAHIIADDFIVGYTIQNNDKTNQCALCNFVLQVGYTIQNNDKTNDAVLGRAVPDVGYTIQNNDKTNHLFDVVLIYTVGYTIQNNNKTNFGRFLLFLP